MIQGDLFSAMSEAEAQRDAGMEQVESHAPEGWIETATAWLEGFLRVNEKYNPDTDNRDGPQPPELRAWGPVTLRAIRSGWIIRIGFTARTRGHCAMGPIYKSLICNTTTNR